MMHRKFFSATLLCLVLTLAALPTGAYAQATTTATTTAATPPAAAPAAPAAAPVPDPTGASEGGIADIGGKDPAHPTLDEVATVAGHNKVSINMVWTLVTGFLVMFMQAGFAMVETGMIRHKNVAHTMAMNFMVYPMGMLGFYVCGFAFMFGNTTLSTMGGYAGLNAEWTVHIGSTDWGILAHKGFFLTGDAYDASVFALFLFQMVFMDTTATIPTGALAERWKYSAFMLYACCIGTFMYPVFGNWVWGGGWLSQLGYADFAGSSVVHMQGGVIGLVGAWLIGPRKGKFNADGTPNAIPGHNIPMAIVGTFILAFGWFGFNPGSTLAGTDLRIAIVATNTMLASATGALATTLWMWWVRSNKPDPAMMCNGLLAGLVAITAPCAYVTSIGACLTGLIAGIIVVESVFFVERVLKIDDPVGAISVHGTCGAWGCIALGLFADGTYGKTGWFHGDFHQFLIQCLGVAVCFVTLAVISFIVFKVIDGIIGNRSDEKAEIEGLDIPEMGVLGYDSRG